MPTFTFSNYDIGNSHIVPDQEGSPSFTIRTERGFMDIPKRTTLTATGGEGCTLDWKNKTMEVKGVVKSLTEVKRKIGGVFSLSSEWQWSANKYVINLNNRTWQAKRGNESIAVYTPLKHHPFKKDELATFNFLSNVSNEELVFLMLALLYSDLNLPPRQPKGFKAATGEAAGGLAVNIAVNSATNCCSIQ